ncbi:PAS domain S-box protein, partial [Candidatus Aerophobetes bacterium]
MMRVCNKIEEVEEMKILIVDDNEKNLYLLETVLEGSGYEVAKARNGIEALQKLKKDSIDIIISDILMPKMDGFQLCRECKRDQELRKIPFIFYTATYTDKEDEEFALSLGAEKFIVKPVRPSLFLKILKDVIREYREGRLIAPKRPTKKETLYLSQYNERLIKKLEKKMLELEEASKTVKESEQKYRELIDNANDAVIFIEPTGYLSFVNPKFCQTMGYTLEEAKKLHFSKLVHPEDSAMVAENFKKRVSGEEVPREYEFRTLTKSGKTVHVEYNSTVIEREGRVVGIQAVARDITRRKQAEEELKQYREHLEELVEQRTAKLEETLKHLEKEVSERKQMEEELRNLNQLRESIIDNANIWLNVLDAKQNVVIW